MKNWLIAAAAASPLAVAGIVTFTPPSVFSSLWPTVAQSTPKSGLPSAQQSSPNPNPLQASTQPNSSSVSSTTQVAPTPTTSPSSAPASFGAGSVTRLASSPVPPAVQSRAKEFTDEAEQLAAITGRRLIPRAEAQSKYPYNTVGRFFNENEPSITVGAGVLIKSDVVLTAGHVIENVSSRESGFGKPLFEIPGHRPVELGDAEIDAAWQQRIVTGDIGVCKLDSAVFNYAFLNPAEIQPTEFDEVDEERFGKDMEIFGYDFDLWIADGCSASPPLVGRSGVFQTMGKRMSDIEKVENILLKAKAITDPYVTLDRLTDSKISISPVVTGTAILGAGTYYLKSKINNSFGWSSEAIGAIGADGGPVFIDGKVVAVTGYPDGKSVGATKIEFGYLNGTRLTGPIADMVEDFR